MFDVAAFYHFVTIADVPGTVARIKERALAADVWGTILVAPEGINSTVSSDKAGPFQEFIAWIQSEFGVLDVNLKWSTASAQPFKRLKVRAKKEIITMKRPEANPNAHVGTYVTPENWNAVITDPDVLVIDTRNTYETDIGIFKGAVDPRVKTFTEFADYVDNHMDPGATPKVAMFCTGGIRCEKASSYMLSKGFETVYHLQGGILKYLETVPTEESLWHGDCFVFDQRIALGHGLEEADYIRDAAAAIPSKG